VSNLDLIDDVSSIIANGSSRRRRAVLHPLPVRWLRMERFNSMSERKLGLQGSGLLPGSDRPVAGSRGPACPAEAFSAAVLEAVDWWWMIEANACILQPQTETGSKTEKSVSD
jgi:hypothetical protein